MTNLAYEVTSQPILNEILKGYESFNAFDEAIQKATSNYPTWNDLPPKVQIKLDNTTTTFGGSYKVLQILKEYITQVERKL